ncbi:MAG: transcriptional regulator NrdR [Nanoarchaeota archaeon]|nr:transcriptional regulator NrdR [Nanoarchaeota archaeon]
MKCPYCGSLELKVIDKRATENNDAFRRRRECISCEKRFTTYERIESVSLIVIKKTGEREQFDRQKLEKGLLRACEKRPVTYEQIENMVTDIETNLRNRDSVEIPSKEIGKLVMKYLKRIDKVAYIRFASVYKEFTDIESFEKEIKKIT